MYVFTCLLYIYLFIYTLLLYNRPIDAKFIRTPDRAVTSIVGQFRN